MPTWLAVFLIIAGVLFAAKLLYVLAFGWTVHVTRGALYVSTSSVRIEAFLEAVPLKPDELLLDLGCGDGRVLRAAHRRYGVRATGFEVNPLAYSIACLLSMRFPGIKIRWGNFWSRDLRDADVIFCYLFPDVMERLASKLEKELKPGTRVISCNFFLPGWNAEKVLRPDSSRYGDPIYVYRIPDALI
jgi:SAM-dependent methyltransferase